jgi:hypothetical protein
MKFKNVIKPIIAVIISGLVMWIIAGLWHNLVLPNINENIQGHHEGLGIMLIGYFILSLLMTYIYSLVSKNNMNLITGLKIGIISGLLWVLPHGLVMAAAHNTSIMYEFENSLWHMFEQGIGGVIISLVYVKIGRSK